jgi:AcrR family transcriptional regulator
MADEVPGLRERRRARTRQTIQEHAMRLFRERGYDATTVSDVAAAAEVSSMTVFRYFPAKEDLVLADEYDPLILERIAERPSGEPLLPRIGNGLIQAYEELTAKERELLLRRVKLSMGTPALRARLWDSQYTTQQAITEVLCGVRVDPDYRFRVWVSAGVCLSAASAALLRWADEDGRPSVGGLIRQVLGILAEESAG